MKKTNKGKRESYNSYNRRKKFKRNELRYILFKYHVSKEFVDKIIKEKQNSKVILTREDIFRNMSIEKERNSIFDSLRLTYKDLCRELLDIIDPRESFNRWILERHRKFPYGKASNECDPLLPFEVNPLPPPSLFREIMEDIPCKIQYTEEPEQMKENIKMYIESLNKMLDKSSRIIKNVVDIDESQRIECLKKCNEVKERMDEILKISDYDKLKMIMDKLKDDCTPYLYNLFKKLIESLCERMVKLADEKAKELVSMKNEIKVIRYYDNNIIEKQSYDHILLSYKNENSISIHKDVYYKLKKLYEMAHKGQIINKNELNFSIWCLYNRYKTLLGGTRRFEGTGLQAAVPSKTFKTMNELFDVSMECFASPFNCFFSNYCSVFSDIDVLFNSSGSFFHFYPTEGSFEANPPFCEEIIESMNQHMEFLLNNAKDKPLSFIIYLPNWMNPPSDAIEYIKKSKYLRHSFVVESNEHRYISGFKIDSGRIRSFQPVHSSIVFFLQNDAAYEKWKPTEEKVNTLKISFSSYT